MAKNRKMQGDPEIPWEYRAILAVTGTLVGYGYNPWPAIRYSVYAVLGMAVVCFCARRLGIISSKELMHAIDAKRERLQRLVIYNSFAFALDTFLPLLNLSSGWGVCVIARPEIAVVRFPRPIRSLGRRLAIGPQHPQEDCAWRIHVGEALLRELARATKWSLWLLRVFGWFSTALIGASALGLLRL